MAVTTLDSNTALVLIDLQHGIVGNPGLAPYPAAEVVERAARLADAFREQGLPVVLVRITAAADGADGVHGRIDGPARAPASGRRAGTSSSTTSPATRRTSS